ncbi:MAG: DUF5125 domain-containing protein [Dysgonamonadaceae bacterium]|jgi:hypothetical protein|nr:DUF5125 domain-containing protein [Dysgonamonadaceae bacterium]
MKKYLYLTFVVLTILNACTKADDIIVQVTKPAPTPDPRDNPAIDLKGALTSANFGDSLLFRIDVQNELPLSSLTAGLYYDNTKVSEVEILIGSNGVYTGKIYVPFVANTPADQMASLKFTLTSVGGTPLEESHNVRITMCDYPYLYLVTPAGEYKMTKTGVAGEYSYTGAFSNNGGEAYIKAIKYDEKTGHEVIFGWDDNETLKQGATGNIRFFSQNVTTALKVTFNALTQEVSPVGEDLIFINGTKMLLEQDPEDDPNTTIFSLDMTLSQNDAFVLTGIKDLSSWWIDPDFFTPTGTAGSYQWAPPITGKYYVMVDLNLRYIAVNILDQYGEWATFNKTTRTGVLWLGGAGKPNRNYTDDLLCLVPMGNGTHQITLKAGTAANGGNVNTTTSTNLYLYTNSDGETSDRLGSTDLINGSGISAIGTGGNNGRMRFSTALTANATYIFTVTIPEDTSAPMVVSIALKQ